MNTEHRIRRKAIAAILAVVSAAGLVVSTSACGSSSAGTTTVKVALTTATDEPLWKLVNQNLEKAGSKVRVKTVAKKSAENPWFKKVLDSQRQFAERAGQWQNDYSVDLKMAYNHYFSGKKS